MQEFSKFLVENWQWLVSVVATLISLIIFIIKKKPSSDLFNVSLYKVLSKIPFYVAEVEKIGLSTGIEKTKVVLDLAIADLSKLLGRSLTIDEVRLVDNAATTEIEGVLYAPTKKGGLGREESNEK